MSRRFFELILAIKQKCHCNEERIREALDLSHAEFNGLIVLGVGREMTGGEFAERMALSPSRGSRVLNKLVVNGYARTHFSPQDRRTLLILLTSKGERARQQIVRHMQTCEDRICKGLSRQDVRQVTSALEKLESVL